MTREGLCEVPQPLEFLEFFGVEPVEAVPEDGYWCYQFSDDRGISLRFSVSGTERSVQTAMSLADALLSLCSHEGLLEVELGTEAEKKWIRALCRYGPADTELIAVIAPIISVRWSTLIVRE